MRRAPGPAQPEAPDDLTRKGFQAAVERLAAAPLADFDGRAAWTDLLRRAAALDATDLHVEPQAERARVRLRVDGDLWDAGALDPPHFARMLGALKTLAGMVGYVHSTPQDGRLDAAGMSVRAATVPVVHGEKVTLRLLAPAARIRRVDALGMEPEMAARWLACVGTPQGMALCVGAAGSGKTTTLYATLIHLHAQGGGRMSVATIEDPVEYEVPDFNQTPVNAARGLTFGAGLRSILRHDPNAILVGEIRDLETARTAFQAALSGHLVMSTMHGTDSVSALYRLLDMGIEPDVLGSGLACVVAQRLVRTVCAACGGGGCDGCAGTGRRGRTGIFELLEVTPEIQRGLRERLPEPQLRERLAPPHYWPATDSLARKTARGEVAGE